MNENLALKLTSYNFLLIILVIFLIIAIVTYKLNAKAFSYTFGNEIFVTLAFLAIIVFMIKEILVYKDDPASSFLLNYSFSASPFFLPLLIIITFIVALGGFFSVLATAGIFDQNPPANNTSIIFSVAIMFLFVIISSIIYFYSEKKDESTLNQIPLNLKYVYNLRTNWTIAFFAFVMFVFILYLVNPGEIMTKYGGPVIFFSLFIGLVMFSMIYIYQYFFANPSKADLLNGAPSFLAFLTKGFYIIGALTLSGLMLYGLLQLMGIFDQSGSNYNTWTHYIVNFLLIGTLIGILYKLITAGGYFAKSPLYRLVLNTILYIPCLLVYILSFVSNLLGLTSDTSSGFSAPTQSEKRVLVIALVLLALYYIIDFFAVPLVQAKITSQGGTQYINQPISLNKLTNIASYQELNGIQDPDIHAYQYALSFWFYIDSFPPSTSASYSKVVQLVSMCDNPAINYDAKNNTLFVSVKQTTEPVYNYIKENGIDLTKEDMKKWQEVKLNIKNKSNELPERRIIYKNSNVLLQKWNNIVLNYNGGTLDIFYNGKLVKSAIEVVPYLTYDMLTVGTENGISGDVSNLVYFKEPLDVATISNIYNTLKDSNPPTLTGDENKLSHYL